MDLSDEWAFLRLTGPLSAGVAATYPEKITLALLQQHVEAVFEEAGVEFDPEAAMLLTAVMGSLDIITDRIEDAGGDKVADLLRQLLEDAGGNPATVFMAMLLLNEQKDDK